MAFHTRSLVIRSSHATLPCLSLAFAMMLVNPRAAVGEDILVNSKARVARNTDAVKAGEPERPALPRIVRRQMHARPLDTEIVQEPYVQEVVLDDNNYAAHYPTQPRVSHANMPVRIIHRAGQPRFTEAGELFQPEEPTSLQLVPSLGSGAPRHGDDVQLTLSVKRENLPQLLEGVVQEIQKEDGNAKTSSKRFLTETPAPSSAKVAGPTPAPDPSQELPDLPEAGNPNADKDKGGGLAIWQIVLISVFLAGICAGGVFAIWHHRSRALVQSQRTQNMLNLGTQSQSTTNYKEKRNRTKNVGDPDANDTGGAASTNASEFTN